MELKTAQILITRKTQDSILEGQCLKEQQDFYKNILDRENRRDLILRIPIKLKGSKIYMPLQSRLDSIKIEKGIQLSLYCKIIKPIYIALILGLFVSGIFHLVYSDIIYSLFALFIIASIYIAIIFSKIISFSEEYLKAISKESYKATEQ